MAEPRDDEFYVGYLPSAPPAIASRVRWAVIALAVVALVLAVVLAASQRRFAASSFEFGVVREFRGVIVEKPHPLLLVKRPGDARDRSVSQYYLVAFGKRGAASQVEGFDGSAVKLRGSLIYRDGLTMVELLRGSIESLGPAAAASLGALRPTIERDLGEQTLIGEIVDTKCFLGVMKPGQLKPHRSCAVRCIAGGIPPALVVFDESGAATYYLLVSTDGGTVNDRVLDLVAEPVEITGRVVRHGDLLVLEADPSGYRRPARIRRAAPPLRDP